MLGANPANAKLWERPLPGLTELQQCMPIHFDFATRTLSRIDRVHTATPKCELAQLKARARMSEAARLPHMCGISDHSAAMVTLELTPQLPPEQRHIHTQAVESATFLDHHDCMVSVARLDSLHLC